MSKPLLAFFDELHLQKVGHRYPVNGAKDGKLLKDLRAIYTDEQLQSFMVAFFTIEDEFIEQAGYSIGVFRACLPKVLKWMRNQDQPKLSKSTNNVIQGMKDFLRDAS